MGGTRRGRAAVGAWQTVADVADHLGVSTRTVLRWVERGELKALRLPGGRLRISQTAYNAWIAAHTTGPERRSLGGVYGGDSDADG
jgi:excisionase family DNA binding protein